MFWNMKEQAIKKEIMSRAEKLATEMYEKEVMFQTLKASDLNYTIIQDLIKAAKLTGKVTIKLKDGTEIVIEGASERDELNSLAQNLF